VEWWRVTVSIRFRVAAIRPITFRTEIPVVAGFAADRPPRPAGPAHHEIRDRADESDRSGDATSRSRHRACFRHTTNRGTSILELLIVVGMTTVLAGTAVPALHNSIRDVRANAGLRAAIGQLQHARELAMTARRTVEVRFDGVNGMRTSRIDGDVTTPVAAVTFENGIEFRRFAGLPDTPDQFGMTAAINFGGATRVFFSTDGSLVDSRGVPTSGTVFLGTASVTNSARALTVVGATGRVQGYRWDGRQWQQ
jgi:Tfp pilus assembly protein FimT